MLIPLLFGAVFLLSGGANVLQKRFQLGFRFDLPHFIWYNFLNAAFAAVNFLISAGGRIEINGVTLLFSAAYGLDVILALSLGVVSLRYLSIPLRGVMSSSGSLLISSLFGILALGEPFSLRTAFAIAAVLAAVVLPSVQMMHGQQNRLNAKGVLVGIAVFLVGSLSTIITKLYTITPGVCGTTQFFLMTNLVILFCCVCAGGVLLLRRRAPITAAFRLFGWRQLLDIVGITLFSNITSVMSITLLGLMTMTSYNIVSAGVGMAASLLVSLLVFRERPAKIQYVSVALVVLATTLCAMQ